MFHFSRERLGYLDRNHFKVFFAPATLGARPVHGHVFPPGAGSNTVLRPAFFLVVDETAQKAHPGFVFGGVAHNKGLADMG